MNADELIVVDDPTILDAVARLAELCACTKEEAIGIAVQAELTILSKAAGLEEA